MTPDDTPITLPALLPCPFCGTHPSIGPKRPDLEGLAWAFVRCEDACCSAQPRVESHEYSGLNSSQKNKADAIRRWNAHRQAGERKTPGEAAVERIDRIAESLHSVAQWMFGMVNLQGGGPDEAPEPASQFDYELSQAAGEVQGAALRLTSKPLGAVPAEGEAT